MNSLIIFMVFFATFAALFLVYFPLEMLIKGLKDKDNQKVIESIYYLAPSSIVLIGLLFIDFQVIIPLFFIPR